MRVSREQFQENRRRILEAAGRLFREKGFSAVTVAEVMEAAGLTHGGFYGHFTSKEDLAAQALAQALAPAPREPGAAPDLAGFVAAYLSAAHRDRPGGGCALAALSGEAARQPAPVRRAFTDGFEARLARMQEALPEGDRAAALAAVASLVGALVLARAVDDPALSDEILAATRGALAPTRP
ncbi:MULTISPECIES: TetR family transcriptional regulator [Methylobacterium]|jgi:TetR/AcrR family transcriptional repressor of nem operon|uniref:TetR/AcrR family transcriptional regulator n=1 Tax=Methylobacterium TaxID=407 RepID=UPI0008F0FF27|nr:MULTISPECIES: TetR family transcriptional regulator [Methylobacterium]MBK3399198.1 TetR/AcrR family transcriptional regulator [Methylobacterium ajmalii]MBK3410734.1 TetR/AcrR family transcriptional regulator [Methylobacterium ajmalii]MBZ6414563.1 TetR/AcrR family transcriptional regulator [Methylobacterium sp.]SFF47221.1 transcriptional regulator, TetR family [Methylobacterium sp. yr596]